MTFPGTFGSGSRDALDREALLREVDGLLANHPDSASIIRRFSSGEVVLGEGERAGQIGLVLEGTMRLVKRSDAGEPVQVDTIGRGEMIGLVSYFSREINFVGVHGDGDGRLLLMPWDAFDALLEERADLADLLGQLMRDNLMGRYRRVVRMHLDVSRLNQELGRERLELRNTIAELEATRNRLINQEKLALLGKIVAGLAHELNNPVAAIARNTDYLAAALESLISGSGDERHHALWRAGQDSAAPDSRALRTRAEQLEQRWPGLSRALLRRLAAVPPDQVAAIQPVPASDAAWEAWLRPFEAGRFIHTLNAASERIARLVRSLKNYARPGQETTEHVDLATGIRDTLLILANRFRETEVIVDLPDELPRVTGNAGELNQVWTNLLVNASEAMGDGGRLWVSARDRGDRFVEVVIQDSGPGIPSERLQTIFEPHYTTKAQGGQFGLGLGLGIAREITHKHAGCIDATNAPGGGARFRVVLPVA